MGGVYAAGSAQREVRCGGCTQQGPGTARAHLPPSLTSPPDLFNACLAAVAQGPAGILVDPSGTPVGSALRLEGLATPRALATSGSYVLAACEDGIHVFDCGPAGGGGEVQQLSYGGGLRPLPGERAGGRLLGGCVGSRRVAPGWLPACTCLPASGRGLEQASVLQSTALYLPQPRAPRPHHAAGQPLYAAGNASGSCVVVAGRAVAWACLPVSLEEQAREVLRRR